jgi:hypothetical protein
VPQLLPLPLFYTWAHIWIHQGGGSASRNVLPTKKHLDHLLCVMLKMRMGGSGVRKLPCWSCLENSRKFLVGLITRRKSY